MAYTDPQFQQAMAIILRERFPMIDRYQHLTAYADFVAETAIFPPSRGVSYCLKKLCGEIGEAVEKERATGSASFAMDYNFIRELGDVLWYAVALARELQIPLDRIQPVVNPLSPSLTSASDLIIHAGRISEAAGKIIRDKGGDDTNESYIADAMFISLATDNLGRIVDCVCDMGIKMGIDIDAIININMDKLLSRRARGTLKGSGDNR